MSGHHASNGPIALASEAAAVWLRHNLVEPFRSRPSLPRAMHYISTHRCNARCLMCGIWKEPGGTGEELSPTDLGAILGDRLFNRMQYVGVSGGEPFLREDLEELCAVILENCPKVKRLSLTTNGLLTRRIRAALPGITDCARRAGVLLDVSVSVHGMGETLARIYGVANAFEKIEQTIEVLAEHRDEGRLSFSMNCVLLSENLASAGELRRWAAGRSLPLSFVVGEHRLRFRTEGMDEAFVGPDGRGPLIDFLSDLAADRDQSATSALKYRELAAMLEGGKLRSLACYYAMGGLLLGHDGRLHYCSHSKEIGNCADCPPYDIYYDPANLEYRDRELIGAECKHCPPYTRTRWEIEKDLGRNVLEIARRRLGLR